MSKHQHLSSSKESCQNEHKGHFTSPLALPRLLYCMKQHTVLYSVYYRTLYITVVQLSRAYVSQNKTDDLPNLIMGDNFKYRHGVRRRSENIGIKEAFKHGKARHGGNKG